MELLRRTVLGKTARRAELILSNAISRVPNKRTTRIHSRFPECFVHVIAVIPGARHGPNPCAGGDSLFGER